MKYSKLMLIMVFAIFICTVSATCAADANETTIVTEDNNQIELTITEDEIQTNENDNMLTQTDNSEILSSGEGTYSDLRADITTKNLTKSYYRYNAGDGDTIEINTSGVINGNGAVIDMVGSNMRAFYVSVSDVTINNLTIKNANCDGSGGAIYFGYSGAVTNCNFYNNTASVCGGAVYFDVYGEVINCYFNNNTASIGGGAVWMNSARVENCNFTNNKATGTYSWGGAIRTDFGTVSNCNFTDNTATNNGGAIYMGYGTVSNCNFVENSASRGGAIFSMQWFTTADTCIFKRNSGDNVNTVIYPPTLNVNNFTTVYGSGEKLTFDLKTNSSIPVTNGNISISVYFKDNGDWVRNYTCLSGEGWIPDLPVGSYIAVFDTEYANFQKINRTLKISDGTTFWDLNQTINADTQSEINLINNYTFNPDYDADFVDGIVINRSVTINGNGFTINAKGKARIFEVLSDNVVLKNIIFKNGNITGDGGAVHFGGSGTVENCNFTNNSAGYAGGAIHMYSGSVENCIFINNTARYGGAIRFYNNGTTTNCNFTNNKAIGTNPWGGAICFSNIGNIANCNFAGNTAEEGGAVYFVNNGTMSNCNFTDNIATIDGGAVYFRNVGEVTNCNFTGNTANDDGGAVYFYRTGTVSNCNFTGNTASINGGAVYFQSTGTVTNCNFTNNKATGTYYLDGGGAVYFKGNGEVTNCNFTDNTATYNGGAVYFHSTGNVTNCNFTGNSARNGGAVYFNDEGSVSNCNFTDNTASVDGGAVYFYRTGTVSNCNYTNNSASYGGAIRMPSGNVSNCNFTDNSANRGGAINMVSGTVKNCNFVNNTASEWGGAIRFSGTGTVSNCNFADNTATYGGAVYFLNTGNVTNCNFVENSASQGGAIYSNQRYTTADTCIFKRNSGDNVNTVIYPPTLNVNNFTTVYGSGEKLTFDLKTNSSIPVTNGNISISVYFKDNGDWVRNYTCLSGEGWIPDLPVGFYIAFFDTEYAEFQKINRTVTITMPNVRYSINVSSVTTNNKTVNITAKSDIPKDILWEGKLIFILPNSTKISANYSDNGTWWAVHEFDKYDVYQVNATYVGLDNVTINNGTITINKVNSTISLDNIVLDYGETKNVTVTTTGATGITAKIGEIEANVTGFVISIPVLDAGTYTLTVTTIPDDDYNPVTKEVNITVNKVNSTLTVGDMVFDYGSSGSIIVSIIGADGVNANVVGKTEAVVKVNGTNITVSGLDAGTYTLTVITIADKNHNNITKNATITVNKVDATLTVDDVALDYGETKNVTVVGEGVVGIVAVIGESVVKVDGFVISIPVLDAGTYTLTVTTIADANHNNVTKNATVTVNKADATLTVDDVVLDYGETKNITVMGEGVVGIVAWIGESVVKVDGFVISIPVLDAGTHTLTVTAIADANHNPVTKEASIRVLKVDSTLSFEKINFDESSIVIAANGASGVTAKIDGVDIVVVDNYTIVIPSLAAGDHILSVTTIPDVSHNPVTRNLTVVVNKLQTELSGNDVIATYNVNTDLVITLKDSAGKALSGVKVTVDLNGAKTYTTDKNGQVKVPTKGLAPKTYTAKITFNGDANHDKSAKNIKVTVKKATPKMTAKKKTFKAKTKTKKYAITLKDNTGKAMKKVKVTLKVKGKTYKAKTNNKGKATFKIKNLKKKGKYTAVIKYKGNKNYNKITKKVKLTVK